MALIDTGADAPDFNLPNQDGEMVKKDDFAGRYVLLWWYPKADTPGWTIEGKGFRDRIQDFKNRNASVVGVSYDSPTDNGAFRDKFSFPYDLLSDEEGVMSIAFGVSEPDNVRSSRKSVLIGPDGKIAAIYDKVTPADHPGQVIYDLDGMSWQLESEIIKRAASTHQTIYKNLILRSKNFCSYSHSIDPDRIVK